MKLHVTRLRCVIEKGRQWDIYGSHIIITFWHIACHVQISCYTLRKYYTKLSHRMKFRKFKYSIHLRKDIFISTGPFLPCEDLFGWWSLRCGVWIVFMLALLGNGVVLFVSVTSRSKMDVPRFLICNLACADFFMGIYLGFLAIVDASTLGNAIYFIADHATKSYF